MSDTAQHTAPLSPLLVLATILCAVGFALDLMEITLSNALAAVFSAPPYSLRPGQLSLLLACVYAGAAIGAPTLGWLADRRGLQKVLMLTLLWLGLTSVLAVVSASFTWFATFRFLSGLALGAYPPLMIAYLTTVAPPRYRGMLIFMVCAVAYLAPPVTIFAIRYLTPLQPFGIEAWRWPFAVGGCLALLVGAGFVRLPEAVRASPTARKAPQTRRFAFIATLYFLHPWATVAFPLLTGPVLLQKGVGLTDTLLYIGAAAMGPAIGTLLGGLIIDRVSRRVAMVACCCLMLVAAALFFVAEVPIGLLIAVVSYGVGVALYSPSMTLYGAEIFPAASRASATASAWALNRVASAIVPFALLPVLHTRGPGFVAIAVCAGLIASIVLIVSCGPRGAAGEALE